MEDYDKAVLDVAFEAPLGTALTQEHLLASRTHMEESNDDSGGWPNEWWTEQIRSEKYNAKAFQGDSQAP